MAKDLAVTMVWRISQRRRTMTNRREDMDPSRSEDPVRKPRSLRKPAMTKRREEMNPSRTEDPVTKARSLRKLAMTNRREEMDPLRYGKFTIAANYACIILVCQQTDLPSLLVSQELQVPGKQLSQRAFSSKSDSRILPYCRTIPIIAIKITNLLKNA